MDGTGWNWLMVVAMAIPPVVGFALSFTAVAVLNKLGWLPNLHTPVVYAYLVGSILVGAAFGAGVAMKL